MHIAVAVHSRAEPSPCRARYVISTVPRRLGDLLELEPGTGHRATPHWRGKKCYSVLGRRPEPCAGCPAFEPAPSKRSHAVLMEDGGPFTVVYVRQGRQSARVTRISISDAVIVDLLHAKVRRRADAGRLSKQERCVLDLLFLGRQTREIATALDISERTVKFHVRNLCEKLSADSRLDLLRRLLFVDDAGPVGDVSQ